MVDIYLIKRRRDGLWWRSAASGYTDDIAQAGHYTGEQVGRYQGSLITHREISIHPAADLVGELEASAQRLEENLARIRRMLAGVRQAEQTARRQRPEHYLEVARQCADLTEAEVEEGDVLELTAEAAATIRAMHRLTAPSPEEGE